MLVILILYVQQLQLSRGEILLEIFLDTFAGPAPLSKKEWHTWFEMVLYLIPWTERMSPEDPGY